MEDFLASSPPAWNGDAGMQQHRERLQNGTAEDDDWSEVEENVEIQQIPNAHFDVLNSSLPSECCLCYLYCDRIELTPDHSETSSRSDTPSAAEDEARRAATALLQQPTVPAPYRVDKPLSRPRWHFGIRSRSPPMEVMLEIYKTLHSLNMWWKRKDGIPLPDIGPRLARQLYRPNEDEEGGPWPFSSHEDTGPTYRDEVELALEAWERESGEVVQMDRGRANKKDAAFSATAASFLFARPRSICTTSPDSRSHASSASSRRGNASLGKSCRWIEAGRTRRTRL